jgi:cell division protein FtsL
MKKGSTFLEKIEISTCLAMAFGVIIAAILYTFYDNIYSNYKKNHSKQKELSATNQSLKELIEYERIMRLTKKYKPEDLVEIHTVV